MTVGVVRNQASRKTETILTDKYVTDQQTQVEYCVAERHINGTKIQRQSCSCPSCRRDPTYDKSVTQHPCSRTRNDRVKYEGITCQYLTLSFFGYRHFKK